jgi:hypothetical protein
MAHFPLSPLPTPPRSSRRLRPLVLGLALLVGALLLVPQVGLRRADAGRIAPEATVLSLEEAKATLKEASSLLRERTSTSEQLQHALAELERVHAAVGTESSAARSFRKKVEDQLLKASLLHKAASRSSPNNERLGVNVEAAAALGRIGAALDPKAARALSVGLRKAITYVHDKRDVEQWEQAHLDALFAALAQINDPASITWILDEYTHTKKREVVFLIAAQQALLRFTDVPGPLRFDICKKVSVTYAGVEALAERNSASTTDRSSKALWDALRVYTIPLLQHYAGEPRDEHDVALSTVGAFQHWIQDHKNLRTAPWLDPDAR